MRRTGLIQGLAGAAALAALSLAGCQTTSGGADGPSASVDLAQQASIVGHRGAAGLKPENTLAGVKAGLARGVDAVEVDVQLSAEGVPVVYHDLRLKPAITRGPDGDWLDRPGPAIGSLSLAELKRYDVGRLDPDSDYAGRYPDQQSADGARIPRLIQVLDQVRKSSDAELWIELKTDPTKSASADPAKLARATLEAVRTAGMSERVAVLSFDWRGLQEVQDLAPDVPTVYLTARFDSFDTLQMDQPGASPWTAGIDVDGFDSVPAAVADAGGRWWAPYHRAATQPRLAAADTAGLDVAVWTLDDPARARRLVARGVDAVITDRPDRMRPQSGS